MKGLLSADLYRLRKQKSTWIIPAATFFVIFLFGCLNGFIYGNAAWLRELHDAINGGIASLAEQTGGQSTEAFSALFGSNFPDLASYITATFQRDSILALIIFASVYVAAVRRNGFIKNVGGVYYSAKNSVVQATVMLAYSFVIVAANVLAAILSAAIFFENTPFGDVGAFALYFVLVAVLHWAECLTVVLLCDVFKSPTVGIVIGCVYTGAVVSLLCTAGNLLFELVLKTDFRLNHVSPYAYSMMMEFGSASSYLYAVGISAVWVLLYFGGKALIKKKDIA